METINAFYDQVYEALPKHLHSYGDIPESKVAEYTKDLDHSIWFPHTIQTCLTISGTFICTVFIVQALKPRCEALKPVICAYNLFMSFWSFYMLVAFSTAFLGNLSQSGFDMSLFFQDPDLKLNQNMQDVYLMFIFTKYVEYLDVLWMVLRGKLDLTSPRCILQVYHHWVTPTLVYSGLYYPWTMSWVGPILNTIVHTMMYFYYGISHFFTPENRKSYRAVGNYIFYTQMLQFFICLLSSCWTLYFNMMSNRLAYYNVIMQYVVFVGLFIVFFMQRKKEMKSKKKKN